MLRSILTEYGMTWAINRSLYSAKLKMMNVMPKTESWFEKQVKVSRIDVFDIDTDQIEDFLKKLPEDKKSALIKEADNACNGIIQAFSSVELNYGNPINWQRNPLTGKDANASIKWYKIPDFDAECGDIKVIWEVSRFTHFYAFARSYLLTGDVKYYQAFSQQLASWITDNQYSYGANYKCGQECVFRMINGLMAYSVFRSRVTQKDEKNMKLLVERCYMKILSNFFYAYKCIKNNHTISELVGMIIGAWCCDDKKTLGNAYRLLEEVIQSQFTEDGGYTQLSFNYQRLALQDIECVLSIEKKTGMTLSEKSKGTVLNSALLMYQCQNCDGDVPNYGSNDGALIFPVTACGYRDYRSTLNTVHTLITKKHLYPPGDYDEELLWFGCSFNNSGTSYIDQQSSAFSQAGIYTIRDESNFMMIVLNDYKTRPAHMDQLHIDLWIKGINVLCDTGTYSYASALGQELLGTGGHNTIKVDCKEQMNRRGAFMITDWMKRNEVEWRKDYFKGEVISRNGYSHTRTVEKNSDGYIISDDVMNSGGFKAIYHTPCKVKLKGNEAGLFWADKLVCTLISDGDMESESCVRSLFYMKQDNINSITIRGKTVNGRGHIKTTIRLEEN